MNAFRAIKNPLSLVNGSGFVSFFFSLLVLSIPMQHKYDKMFRSLSKAFANPTFDLVGLFETKVFICIFDVLVLALFLSIVFTKRVDWKSLFWEGPVKYLTLFFLVTLSSIFLSHTSGYGLQYIRWLQLFWVGFIVLIIGSGLITADKKGLLLKFFSLVVITSLFQCFVAVSQYFTQHSLGLAKLGEMKLALPGSACFGVSDGSLWIFDRLFSVPRGLEGVIRAYGTFPHPNMLGGFLVFSLFASYFLYQKAQKPLHTKLLSIVLFSQVFSLCITYSRSALFGWIIGSLVWFGLSVWKAYQQKNKLQSSRIRSLALMIFASFGICFFLFYPQLASRGGVVNYTQTLAQGADAERIAFQSIAASIVETKPLTGVGYNNYVLSVDEYSDTPSPKFPVHNIFLLIAAETGLVGLLCFLVFLALIAIRMLKSGLDVETITLFSLFTVFMFIGCCDCYLIEGPEGKPMFFITLGLITMMGRKSLELAPIKNTVAVSV